MKEATKIEVRDSKTNQVTGYLGCEQFKVFARIPKSSTRFLKDIIKDWNRKNPSTILSHVLA